MCHPLQVVMRMSGAAVMGLVCLRMLCVTRRRTAKMEATRPLVKPVSGSTLFSSQPGMHLKKKNPHQSDLEACCANH